MLPPKAQLELPVVQTKPNQNPLICYNIRRIVGLTEKPFKSPWDGRSTFISLSSTYHEAGST